MYITDRANQLFYIGVAASAIILMDFLVIKRWACRLKRVFMVIMFIWAMPTLMDCVDGRDYDDVYFIVAIAMAALIFFNFTIGFMKACKQCKK